MFGRLGIQYVQNASGDAREPRPTSERVVIPLSHPGELGMLLRLGGVIAVLWTAVALVMRMAG